MIVSRIKVQFKIIVIYCNFYIDKIPGWIDNNLVNIEPTIYYHHIDNINVNHTTLVISTMLIINFKVSIVLLTIVILLNL